MGKMYWVFVLLAVLVSVQVRAEDAAAVVMLPDAPVPTAESMAQVGTAQSGGTAGAAIGDSTLIGSVDDPAGAAIEGAQVGLDGKTNGIKRSVMVDSRGEFEITRLPAGSYQLLITLPGQPPSVPTDVELGAKQEQVLPIVMSRTPMTETTVHVVASTEQVAAAQVKLEEKQRVLGVVPNFYTSYIWNSAPLSTKLKYKLALRSIVDPVHIAGSAVAAGIEQANNTFPGYGDGPDGYGKRFGANYANTAISTLLGRAVFPEVFHQDPRYFYRGTGSKGSRIWYAMKSTVVTRGDNGNPMPNYSHVLGIFATAGIANIYRAPSDRDASTTIEDSFITLAGSLADNLLREFISRPLTKNVPAFATGKASH